MTSTIVRQSKKHKLATFDVCMYDLSIAQQRVIETLFDATIQLVPNLIRTLTFYKNSTELIHEHQKDELRFCISNDFFDAPRSIQIKCISMQLLDTHNNDSDRAEALTNYIMDPIK